MIKRLNKRGIVHCVCCAQATDREGKNFGQDWFITASRKDRKELIKLDFSVEQDYKEVMTYSMTEGDYNYFQKHKEDYVKVVHNKFGKIYELKTKSFRDYETNIL